MFYRSIGYAVAAMVGVMLAMTPAGATTYTYTGIAGSGDDGYHVSATVDLSCGGACTSGTYYEGGTLTSLALSIVGPTPSNASVFSISSTDANYIGSSNGNIFGVPSYLTLSNAGGVITITNWLVFADINTDTPLGSINYAIYTTGNDTIGGLGTGDYFDNATLGIGNGSGTSHPGVWSGPGIVSTTPLPSTWTMLIAGFAGLGFLAYRGTKKRTAALAA
jgi:hypothetical protein